MAAFLDIGHGQLMEEAVDNCRQRWPIAAKEPEEAEQHWQVVGLAEDVGSDEMRSSMLLTRSKRPMLRRRLLRQKRGSLDEKP